MSTTNPTGPLVTLGSLGVTSCYYIAANGSDSNSGLTEATPWLHAPGMPSCSGKCAAANPSGGQGFIFRGGDTWHEGNSSATPYVGSGGWLFTWSGASMNSPIYVGVDQTWYSGNSWARPIITEDNPTSTTPVSKCVYSGIDQVYLSGVRYIFFDNFEITGICWNSPTAPGGNMLHYTGAVAGTGNPAYIQNNYLHGWTYTTAGTQAGASGIETYNQNYGETIRFNVIDGSDSDYHALQAFGQGGDGYDLEYNIVRYAGGTTVFDDCHIQHDNLFEYMSNVTDGSSHTDVDFCYGEYSGGPSNPNVFYNNVFRYIGTLDSATISYNFTIDTPIGQTDYVFNNVFHDFYGGDSGYNYNAMCDGGDCGPTIMWNNTAEGAVPVYGWVWANGGTEVVVKSVNDHWITAGTGTSASFTGPSYVTETNAVYQTISAANSQGFTSSNDFAPTAASDATVGTGSNQTTGYCSDSVLHNAAAEAACVQGITGVAYNSTSHAVIYPAVPAVSRPPTGPWNVGAFQFPQ